MTDDLDTFAEYDEATGQWIDTRTGEPIDEQDINAEILALIDAAGTEAASLTEDLYSGILILAAWQAATALLLKDAHLAMAALATGGFARWNQDRTDQTQTILDNEMGFFENFAQDVVQGLSAAMAINRIRQYTSAAQQSYWGAWSDELRAQDEAVGGNPLTPLPRVPGDGSTDCRGNCKCFLSYRTNVAGYTEVDWNLTAEESCSTCLDMEAGNPWAPK